MEWARTGQYDKNPLYRPVLHMGCIMVSGSDRPSNADRMRNLQQTVQQRIDRLRGDGKDRPSSGPAVASASTAPPFISAGTGSSQVIFSPGDPRIGSVYQRCDLHGQGSAIQVSLEILRQPCCAHLMAGVPILRNLEIRLGTGVELLRPLIRLSVQPREVCGEWLHTPGSLSSGGTILVSEVQFPLRPELFAARTGFMNLSIQVTLEDSGVTLFAVTHSLRLLPAHTIPLTAGRHDDSCWMVATSVRPDASALLPLVKTCGEALQQLAGVSSLEGYSPLRKQLADSAGDVRLNVHPILSYVHAACHALNHHLTGYVTSPPEAHAEWQRIRTIEELLISRHGNCLDYSVLTASLLEAIGLDPFVVMLPGHAIVGCSLVPQQWLGDASSLSIPLLTTFPDVASLQTFCDQPLLFIECTSLPGEADLDVLATHGLNALKAGLEQSIELANRLQPVTAVSIRAARHHGIQATP